MIPTMTVATVFENAEGYAVLLAEQTELGAKAPEIHAHVHELLHGATYDEVLANEAAYDTLVAALDPELVYTLSSGTAGVWHLGKLRERLALESLKRDPDTVLDSLEGVKGRLDMVIPLLKAGDRSMHALVGKMLAESSEELLLAEQDLVAELKMHLRPVGDPALVV